MRVKLQTKVLIKEYYNFCDKISKFNGKRTALLNIVS